MNRVHLEQLRPETFSSILILANDPSFWGPKHQHDNIADADSRCLASLLLLRDIQSSRMRYGNPRLSGARFLFEGFPWILWIGGKIKRARQVSDCPSVAFHTLS